MEEILYKYRSLSNLKWFLDILINRRLYASKYLSLNDPMEGFFTYDPTVPRPIVTKLRDERANTLICSLSKTYNNGLMWSMYGDEHKGCCLKLKVTSKIWTKLDIDYTDMKTLITDKNASIETILSTKSKQWEHEKEVRYIITNSNSSYLKISIDTIYLGAKMNRGDVSFYTSLIHSIDEKINVKKLALKDIDFGLR